MDQSTDQALNNGDLSGITTYQAGIMQSSVNRTLQKVSDAALRPYGISKMQWMVIGVILDAGPSGARITDMAKTLDTTLPYLTNSINYLESKAIVQRLDNQKDSRSKLVRINPAFVPTCTEIEAILRQALRDSIYNYVDPQDFRTYMKVLYKMYKIR